MSTGFRTPWETDYYRGPRAKSKGLYIGGAQYIKVFRLCHKVPRNVANVNFAPSLSRLHCRKFALKHQKLPEVV